MMTSMDAVYKAHAKDVLHRSPAARTFPLQYRNWTDMPAAMHPGSPTLVDQARACAHVRAYARASHARVAGVTFVTFRA